MSFIQEIYPQCSAECVRIYETNKSLFNEIFRIGANSEVKRFKRTGRTGPVKMVRPGIR
jgi:hypothetical protein